MVDLLAGFIDGLIGALAFVWVVPLPIIGFLYLVGVLR